MQIDRLFHIVYLLLEQKSVSAKELAERFEVSTRTIYRDIDTLSAAGIPVYANRGSSGGFQLIDDFVLNKSLLTDEEQNEILASLQGLNAIHTPDVEPVLTKLAAVFGKKSSSWIDVDLSNWGGGIEEKDKFILLKDAILNKKIVCFEYFGSNGKKSIREAEPVQIWFKGHGWYLYAFCRNRQDWRIFKITRMKKLISTQETYHREPPEISPAESGPVYRPRMIHMKLKLDASLAYRVYDEFEEERIQQMEDGSFIVELDFPEGGWVYGFVLSFGAGAQVLEPEFLRRDMITNLEKTLKNYQ